MQIKIFVIKPTHRNGFLVSDLMVLTATGRDFHVRICRFSSIKALLRVSIVVFFVVVVSFVFDLLAPKSKRRNGA